MPKFWGTCSCPCAAVMASPSAETPNQHRAEMVGCLLLWALGLVLALVPLRSLAADGPPTQTGVEQLVDYLRSIPPLTYEIEVIAEFVLPKQTEKTIREAVSDVFSRMGGASALQGPPGTNPELEQEIQRLLAEQEQPRRMRKRCISSRELGYRLEQVVEHNGPFYAPNETGPAETAAISEINVNVGNKPGDSRSVYLSPIQSLAGLHASGRRVLEEDVWAGGTLGPLLAGLLRSSLAIDAPEEPKQIDLLVKGRHPIIAGLTLDRDQALPDGKRGRRFTFSIKDSKGRKAAVAFDVPADSFDPVWLVTIGGKKILEVTKAEDGIAKEWIEYNRQNAPDGTVHYKTISRVINKPVDPALFEFRAPEGWDCIDHTVNPPKIIHADGTIEYGKPMRTPEAAAAAERPRSTNRSWFLIGNALIVFALLLRYLLPWFRQKKPVR